MVSLVKQVRTLEALTKDQPPPERPVLKGPPQTPRTAGGIVRYLYGDVQQAGGDAVRFFADDVVYEDMNYETPFVAHLARDKGHSNVVLALQFETVDQHLPQRFRVRIFPPGLPNIRHTCRMCVVRAGWKIDDQRETLDAVFKHWLGIVESIHFWVD